MAEYYDVVLGVIPLTLVAVSGGLVAAGMALSIAVPLAGFVVIALIGHALFVRTPAGTVGQARTTETPEFNSAD